MTAHVNTSEIKEKSNKQEAAKPPLSPIGSAAVFFKTHVIETKLYGSLVKWVEEKGIALESIELSCAHLLKAPTKPDNPYGLLKACIEGQWWIVEERPDPAEENRSKAIAALSKYDCLTINGFNVTVNNTYLEISKGQYSRELRYDAPDFDSQYREIKKILGLD